MTTLERASSDIVVGYWRLMLERHSEKRYGGVAQNLHLKCPDNLKPAYTEIYLRAEFRPRSKRPHLEMRKSSTITPEAVLNGHEFICTG